jgi:hypothetical protein
MLRIKKIDGRAFRYKRCNKCDGKVIYALVYCDPWVLLCVEHAPRMSDGSPGYKKLHIVREEPIDYGHVQQWPADPNLKAFKLGGW